MSILAALQAKVNAVDSSTSMSEILKLMYTVKDHPYKSVYDSAGAMPLDSASVGSIRYADNRNAMYMLVGVDSGWKLIDSDASTAAPVSFSLQGSNFGYALGTGNGPSYYNNLQTSQLEAYPYTSDAGGTDVGDLAEANNENSGGASSTHGYRHGGKIYPAQSTEVSKDTSEKFTFASNTQIGLLPNMTQTQVTALAQREAVTNGSHNYLFGGAATAPGGNKLNVIQKAATTTDTAFTDVGDLLQVGTNHGGHASTTHAYAATSAAAQSDIIQKVPFASDGNSTDVGDAGGGQGGGAHNSSSTHGYMYGGYISTPPYTSNAIHKFSFASDGNSTSVATLPAGRSERGGGNQSTTNGYFHNASAYSTIYRFPFAAEDTITNVGNISDANGARYNGSTQY